MMAMNDMSQELKSLVEEVRLEIIASLESGDGYRPAALAAIRCVAEATREARVRMMAAGGPEVRKACGLDSGKGDMNTIWRAMHAASVLGEAMRDAE
jgi:hypothetical protein